MHTIINERWEILIENWMKSNNYSKVYFVITKKCGYEFLVTLYKKQTLKDLYNIVKLELDCLNKIELYVQDQKKILIDNNDSNIKEWIHQNLDKLEVTTIVPNPVAYRLWIIEK